MKNTINMLVFVGTTMLTWMGMGFIGYMLSDAGYKDCMTDTATIMAMVVLGWVPAVIVISDIDKYLSE